MSYYTAAVTAFGAKKDLISRQNKTKQKRQEDEKKKNEKENWQHQASDKHKAEAIYKALHYSFKQFME